MRPFYFLFYYSFFSSYILNHSKITYATICGFRRYYGDLRCLFVISNIEISVTQIFNIHLEWIYYFRADDDAAFCYQFTLIFICLCFYHLYQSDLFHYSVCYLPFLAVFMGFYCLVKKLYTFPSKGATF